MSVLNEGAFFLTAGLGVFSRSFGVNESNQSWHNKFPGPARKLGCQGNKQETPGFQPRIMIILIQNPCTLCWSMTVSHSELIYSYFCRTTSYRASDVSLFAPVTFKKKQPWWNPPKKQLLYPQQRNALKLPALPGIRQSIGGITSSAVGSCFQSMLIATRVLPLNHSQALCTCSTKMFSAKAKNIHHHGLHDNYLNGVLLDW